MSTQLMAISPIDGRYQSKTTALSPYFSEYGLIKYRVLVEVEYFIALCQIPLPQLEGISTDSFSQLRAIYQNFDLAAAEEIKKIEQTTNHDVKAVEYFLKQQAQALGLNAQQEFLHFGLTSQDINNTAIPLLLRDAYRTVYLPQLELLLEKLHSLGQKWKAVPMLSRTHGQAASPTLLGKEILVFWDRLYNQLDLLEDLPFMAKFGGAVGNFNAHQVAYPHIDWLSFGDDFVQGLGLTRYDFTTQIAPYDFMAAFFNNLQRINTILLDLCRDIWAYISMAYFKQQIKKGEVGSSTMPHKVNPIDFENAEGNLGMANAILAHLSAKLPISRLQRDLSDSTVLRNIGVPIAHTMIALQSILKGLNKISLNKSVLKTDLDNHWEVVTEAIQTILRREGYPNPYEALKKLSRTNEQISKKNVHDFIKSLDIDQAVKKELRKITPSNYTGSIYEVKIINFEE